MISGDPGTPPRYAVPDFVALTPESAEIAKTLGLVLWDDLAFEREFYLIPRDTYATVPAARRPEDVPFSAWRELGADAVIFGSVQTAGTSVTVQVRLFNVRTQQSVFAKEYAGNDHQPAALRPHHRRRDPPAAARAARRGAHQAGLLVGSQPRARWRARSTTAT